jgi:ribosomal protein S18 acetylase RimI-like enzyme
LAKRAFDASFVYVLAYEEKTPVGFCRAISDGFAYALIVDTMVVPSRQRSGIGSAMMETLLKFLQEKKIVFTNLISSKEGKAFYEKLGFRTRSLDEPGMVLSLRK